MICCCSLAGTAACKNCRNYKTAYEDCVTTDYIHTGSRSQIVLVDELDIISRLNQHIADLKTENEELKRKLYENN